MCMCVCIPLFAILQGEWGDLRCIPLLYLVVSYIDRETNASLDRGTYITFYITFEC